MAEYTKCKVCVALIVDEEDLVDQMVDRFLGWKLPQNFSPDAGIKFTKPECLYPHIEHPEHLWPTGTNLLDADQAKTMVRYLLGIDEEDIAACESNSEGETP